MQHKEKNEKLKLEIERLKKENEYLKSQKEEEEMTQKWLNEKAEIEKTKEKQKQLEKNCIEHLCLYGKFEKDTSRIDINEIINASEKGFVFICDAINEMSDDHR